MDGNVFGGTTPESCDCCGHDAEDCGMEEFGWLTRDPGCEYPGTYCLDCASLLGLVLWSEHCALCGIEAVSAEATEREGWRYFADGWGHLVPFCAVCVAAEFGIAPPSATKQR